MSKIKAGQKVVGLIADVLNRAPLFITMAMLQGFAAFAAPTVTDVVAKQRYPWNGLVDITCKVTGLDEGDRGSFRVEAVFPDSCKTQRVENIWVIREGLKSNDLSVNENADYHLLWDAKADLGKVHYTNMTVFVMLDRDKVQLWEGGPYWATMNIGAEKPEDYGYYFWWGDTVGYKRENNKWVASDGLNSNFSFTASKTYGKDNSILQSEGWITSDGVLAPEHDAAQVQWGGEWRMPTDQEFRDINNKCDWIWTTTNGVKGYVVRGRGSYASNSIFLPCAGNGVRTSLDHAGSYGAYWSSVPFSGNYSSWSLVFNSSRHDASYNCDRCTGRPVRPLQGFTK